MTKRFFFDASDAEVLTSIDDECESVRRYDADVSEIVDTVDNVKRELARKMELARKYGFDEYGDELARLLEKLNVLRRGERARA